MKHDGYWKVKGGMYKIVEEVNEDSRIARSKICF